MKRNYLGRKLLINALAVLLGALMIVSFLIGIQRRASWNYKRSESEVVLDEALEILRRNEESAEQLARIYHQGNQEIMEDIRTLLESGLYDKIRDMRSSDRSEVFRDVVERSGVSYLFIMEPGGTVVLSPQESMFMRNLKKEHLLSEENLKVLTYGTGNGDSVNPVLEENESGSYYFYSMPIEGGKYVLVLGEDSEILKVQFSSLTDVRQVLTNCAMKDDSFLFAVDRLSGSFLYFNNGNLDLTGENAVVHGLSRQAMSNGYAGIQNIEGDNYFCVTREYDHMTVICAATETGSLYEGNSYVLFWSVGGFVVLVLLCIAYAVIIRNELYFTKKKPRLIPLGKIRKTQFLLNKDILGEVMPLIMVGIVSLFGLTYYAESLLEISNAVETAEIALADVEIKVRENVGKAATIEKYYDDAFISRAQLISHILSEDPEVLNTWTNHIHSRLDENGEKIYLLDDEGHPLRSVARSEVLQDICRRNDLDSIYIFDERGRVIATSGPDWDFILSNNPEDQSYEFRSLLDGKKDSLVQRRQDDDFGRQNQYIGVPFTYYTYSDDMDKTVYVSRMAYDDSQTENYDGPEIHEHHSILQFSLNGELIDSLLAYTDIPYVLSNVNLGAGGFLIGFDNTDEHQVIYSPIASQLGRSAEEIGLSSKAFSGTYNGFQRIDGITYFQVCRMNGNYFVAGVIPRQTMHRLRLPLCLITSGLSLLFILLVLSTLILTTEKEEQMYAEILNTLRQPEFRIINRLLPEDNELKAMDILSRWDNHSIRWRDCPSERKLARLLKMVVGLVVLIGLGIMALHPELLGERTILRYVLSGGWERSLNAFSVSACILVLLTTVTIIGVVGFVIRQIAPLTGPRSETIARLLYSILKCFGALGAIFYCLYLLGINASSLLASAGIMTAVVGFGAQSLISDILAGIFIAFEGEFRVGDIIMIDGYRGTVLDIGLRTTKMLDADRNIRIFNNSKISGVINMTRETSLARIYITVGYDVSTKLLENILKEELPKIRKRQPMLIGNPFYSGIEKMDGNGKTVLIKAHCREEHVDDVKRALNRELLMIMEDHGINIFPTIEQPVYIRKD